jgi:hypothetical protein
MAATPQKGVFQLRGLKTGLTRSVQIYVSDVANAPVKFDSGTGAGANSNQYYTVPEDCIITDYAQVTGTVDTTAMMITIDNASTSNILTYAIHLTTLNNRPVLAIKVPAGHLLGAIQLA